MRSFDKDIVSLFHNIFHLCKEIRFCFKPVYFCTVYGSTVCNLFRKISNRAYNIYTFFSGICACLVVQFFFICTKFTHISKDSNFTSDRHIKNINGCLCRIGFAL